MTRSITSTVSSTVASKALAPILMAQFEFPSGDLNMWTGYGDLTWNSITFLGAGDLGGVSPITETQSTKATGVDFTLSGIPQTTLSDALSEEYQNRPCSLWFAVLDSSKSVVADPYLIFKGRMDVMSINEGGDTASITLSAENVLISLERPNERRYTPEDQKSQYSGDTGFDQIVDLQDREIIWGQS